MRNSNLTSTMIALMTGAIFMSCNPSSDRGSNTRDNSRESTTNERRDLGVAGQKSKTEVDNYRTTTSERIAENNRIITDYKTRSVNDNSANKTANDKIFADLEKRNTEMKRKMDDYKYDDNDSNWEKFKREFNRDMDALNQDFQNSTSRNNK